MDHQSCAACPLAGTGKTCPSWDWPAFCKHAAREAGLHPDQRYWTGQILQQAGVKPPPPLPPGTLVLRGHGTATGYGRMAGYLARAIAATGQAVAFDCIEGVTHDIAHGSHGYPDTGYRAVTSAYFGPCVQMSSPWAVNRPGNVLFSMFETSRLPIESVATYNAARAIVVPCHWNVDVFRDSGVTVPIRVVPLGVDTAVFHPMGDGPDGEFVVLSVNALGGGGHRKGVGRLVDAFIEALGHRPDARLILKISRDDTFDAPDHPRVAVDRAEYDDAGLAGLYGSSSVYATMTCSEGWGMPGHEALACGRPVIGPMHTGMADYLTADCCYPVAYRAEPARGEYYEGLGDWYPPDHASMVARLREAYADPHGRRVKGHAAAKRAASFSWDHSAGLLLAVLREFGLVDGSPIEGSNARQSSSRPSDPRLALIGACPHRGSILPLSEQTGGCGCGGRELSECRAGKGKVAGRVTTSDCLACVEAAGVNP